MSAHADENDRESDMYRNSRPEAARAARPRGHARARAGEVPDLDYLFARLMNLTVGEELASGPVARSHPDNEARSTAMRAVRCGHEETT